MKRLIREVAALALLASVSLGSATLAHAAMASPQTYALKASDLGKGFTMTKSLVLTNAKMAARAGVSKELFEQHGRISGYEAEFEQQSTGEFVLSQVFTYKTPAGAHWDFTQFAQNVQANGYKRTPGPKMGSESLDLAYQKKQGNLTAVGYTVLFRQGSIDNSVTVTGFKGTVTLGQAVRNVHIVVAREPNG
jgi:hypothetical protein